MVVSPHYNNKIFSTSIFVSLLHSFHLYISIDKHVIIATILFDYICLWMCHIHTKNKNFILFSFSPSLKLFVILCRPEIFAYIIFLLSKRLYLIFLTRHVYWRKFLWFIFIWKVFTPPSFLLKIFQEYRILGLFAFLSKLQIHTLLISCLHGFWGEVKCNFYVCFSLSMVFFSPLRLFSGFFFFSFFDFFIWKWYA